MITLDLWHIAYLFIGTALTLWVVADGGETNRVVLRQPVRGSLAFAFYFWILVILWPMDALFIICGRLFGRRFRRSVRRYKRSFGSPPSRSIL